MRLGDQLDRDSNLRWEILFSYRRKERRDMWKKARIHELLQGRDGRIRTVSLLLPHITKISRPVQLVIPLEMDQGGEDVED